MNLILRTTVVVVVVPLLIVVFFVFVVRTRLPGIVVVIPFILDGRLTDAPAGVTQEEGHTGFLIHLPSTMLALIFYRENDSAVPFPRRP